MTVSSPAAAHLDTPTIERLPDDLAERVVSGINVEEARFVDVLGEEPTLVVFLRHLGCVFCHETVRDLKAVAAREPRLPRILFLYPAKPEQGEDFFASHWPEARAIADPDLDYYRAFGLDRAKFWQHYGPRVVLGGIRAALKGNRQSLRPKGDDKTMPGVALMRGRRVLHVWKGQRVSDRPQFGGMVGG